MISPANQLVLNDAINRVVQQRATAADATRNAGLKAAAAPTYAAPKAKAKATAKPKTPKAAAPAATATAAAPAAGTPGASSISPYLTANDLMGLNDQQAAAEGKVNDATAGLQTTAATALNSSGNIERSRVQNVANANNDAAARGIYNSGIRLGNTGMANANAGRGQEQLVRGVALATQQAGNQVTGAKNQLGGYLQALIQKSAENGAALPVDPYSSGNQNGAVNVPGAKTVKAVAKGAVK